MSRPRKWLVGRRALETLNLGRRDPEPSDEEGRYPLMSFKSVGLNLRYIHEPMTNPNKESVLSRKNFKINVNLDLISRVYHTYNTAISHITVL